MVSPLIRPYFLGGGSFGGGTLDSHDYRTFESKVVLEKTTPQNTHPFFKKSLSKSMGRSPKIFNI